MLCAFPAQAREDLAYFEGLYLKGDYRAIAEKLDAMQPGNFPDSEMPRVRYLYAISLIKTAQLDKAITFLNSAIGNSRRDDRLTFLVCLQEAQMEEKDLAGAVKTGTTILEGYPRGAYEAVVLLRMGTMYKSLENSEKAAFYFKKVISAYPLSFEAKEAKNMLESPDLCFTVQAGAFGQQDNALQLKDELTQKGYPAFISVAQRQGKSLYRVRISCFRTQQSAEDAIVKLKKQGYSAELTQ
jgi:tetratricopeptide (TPR) repeat protein